MRFEAEGYTCAGAHGQDAGLASIEWFCVGPDREIVNRLSGVRIGPSPGERTTRHTATIPTDQRATDAAIATCTITRTR